MEDAMSSDVRPIIGVYFDAPGKDDTPLDNAEDRAIYQRLQTECDRQGACMVILRAPSTYQGKGYFSRCSRFVGENVEEHPCPIRPDLIWNKGNLSVDGGDPIVNDPHFDALCRDKWRTIQHFPNEHSPSFLIHTAAELTEALQRLTGELVVTKPLLGEGGAGVAIGSPESVFRETTTFPCIAQQFIDTRGGIPGIVEGAHDVRLISLGGEAKLCFIRQPPTGSWTANISRGGSAFAVPIDRIPSEALALYQAIDAKLQSYPTRLYAVDMGRDRTGAWRLFELNSRPGFIHPEHMDDAADFFESLAIFLLQCTAHPSPQQPTKAY